ncbi:MAG: TetR family transcriptional regulator [Streptosporangiaceae bacterium]|nr:TetR family transcriptional regulator [Streptosporangiaceae bacterium]
MTELSATQQTGLRERKKARTRASIREHALRLFREQGYQATTVEQIAAAAEVSPSTFFRYFPTKEDVVLQDDMDVRMFEALGRQPSGMAPIPAIRAAMREALATLTPADWEQLRETTTMTMTVPEVRARSLDEFMRTIQAMSEVLAKRAGRRPDDVAVRTLVGAVFGVITAISVPYTEWSMGEIGEDWFRRIDEGLALLEAGLPL